MDLNARDSCSLCIGIVGFHFLKSPLDLIRRLIDVVVFPFLVVL